MSFVRQKRIDVGVQLVLGSCALISVLTTFGIIFVLAKESFQFFSEVSIIDFFIWNKMGASS